MSEQQAIVIAQGYGLSKFGKELMPIRAWYYDGQSQESMFHEHPTWEIWFRLDVPEGVVPRQVIVYVDDVTNEPWQMNFGMNPEPRI